MIFVKKNDKHKNFNGKNVSCRIMSFAKGGRRMKDTDYKDCDYKEVCCKNGFDCGGCLYGAIYQLALKHEQEEKENKKMSTYS